MRCHWSHWPPSLVYVSDHVNSSSDKAAAAAAAAGGGGIKSATSQAD